MPSIERNIHHSFISLQSDLLHSFVWIERRLSVYEWICQMHRLTFRYWAQFKATETISCTCICVQYYSNERRLCWEIPQLKRPETRLYDDKMRKRYFNWRIAHSEFVYWTNFKIGWQFASAQLRSILSLTVHAMYCRRCIIVCVDARVCVCTFSSLHTQTPSHIHTFYKWRNLRESRTATICCQVLSIFFGFSVSVPPSPNHGKRNETKRKFTHKKQ